jgi:hypothetical protein
VCEFVCVCDRERERERECVCVCARARACVCVCVRVRGERERERESTSYGGRYLSLAGMKMYVCLLCVSDCVCIFVHLLVREFVGFCRSGGGKDACPMHTYISIESANHTCEQATHAHHANTEDITQTEQKKCVQRNGSTQDR